MSSRSEESVTTVDAQAPGVPRRTIVKGAAWSVPVIAATVAAPGAAASVPVECEQVGQMLETRADTSNWITARAELPAIVPAGATRMHFVVVGGSGSYATGPLGKGAYIEGDVAVTAGDVFYLQAGASGEHLSAPAGTGRGGKSLYGNGGDSGRSAPGTPAMHGESGGGASALLSATREAVIVAGGGGGLNVNIGPAGDDAGLYSGSLLQDQLAKYGASTATGLGGYSAAGMPGEVATTGILGWMGMRPSVSTEPTPEQIVLMAGGGLGGGPTENAPGAGGTVEWVSGPNFGNQWVRAGNPGNGHNGGHGVVNPAAPGGISGGGGGGYSGGGSGASVCSVWQAPPAAYRGDYGVAAGGGGGSSFVRPDTKILTATLDRRNPADGNGEMGYVQVTFYTC